MSVWFLLLCVCVLLPSLSHATTYYVATGGSNGNAGTALGAPWATLQHAADVAGAGDTVYVRGGTYSQRVNFPNSGSAGGGYITFQAYPGETPLFSGSGLGAGVMMVAFNKNYIKVIGFEIADNLGGGIAFSGQCSHIEIRNNIVRNQSFQFGTDGHAIGAGSLCWPNLCQMDHVVIDGNIIHDVVTGSGDIFDEAMTISWDVDTFQMTNNTLYNVAYIGMDMIGKSLGFTQGYLPWTIQPTGSPWPRNGLVAGNTVYAGGYLGSYPNTAIYMDGAQNVLIQDNTVHDFTRYGIVISAEDGDFQTQQIIVRRNKAYNNYTNIDCGGFSGQSTHIRCAHNTMYNPTDSGMFNAQGADVAWKNNLNHGTAGVYLMKHYLGTTDTPVLNGNLYWPDTFFEYKGATYLTYASYRAGTGQDATSVLANPLFVPGTVTPGAGSPAIDAGIPLTTAVGSGTSTTLPVVDARWFSDGYGVTAGDTIRIGGNTRTVTGVNYGANTVALNSAVTWTNGLSVTYPYAGSAPDIGADEFGGATLTAPTTLLISGTTVTGTLSVDLAWSYTQGGILATGFRLYRQTNCTGSFAPIGGTMGLTPTTVTDSGIALSSSLCWYVVAMDAGSNESTPSNTVRWDAAPEAPLVMRAAPGSGLDPLGVLVTAAPVVRTHPLLAGLSAWWKVVRPLYGGTQLWNLAGGSWGAWDNLTSLSGYRPASRRGGEGEYLFGGPTAFGGDAARVSFGVNGSPGRVGAVPTPAFTFMAWVRGAQPTRTSLALHRPAGIGTSGWALYYDPAAGPAVACEVDIDVYGTFPGPTRTLAPLTLDDTWTHLACTYDGSQLAVYVNGVRQASTVASSPLSGLNEFFLAWNGIAGTEWAGRIDDVQYYGVAKTSGDIGALMALSTQGAPGLLRRVAPWDPALVNLLSLRTVRRGLLGGLE